MTKGRQGVPSRQLESERFVESCGAILFDLSNPRNKTVCIVRTTYNGEWHLAKGRKNYNETRKDAAIREVMEETGFRCKLFPVTMPTHATPPDADADFPDRTRVYDGLTEPFWCTIREMQHPKRTKIIWWYVAVLDEEDERAEKLPGEEKFKPEFLDCKKALETLTYQTDRDILAKAIMLVNDTLFGTQAPGHALEDAHQESTARYTIPRKRKRENKEPQVMTKEGEMGKKPKKLSKKQKARAQVELAQKQASNAAMVEEDA